MLVRAFNQGVPVTDMCNIEEKMFALSMAEPFLTGSQLSPFSVTVISVSTTPHLIP